MPPGLCPSPRMLDYSFPRTVDDLAIVSRALGELDLGLEEKRWVLVVPDVFGEYLDSFEWEKCDDYPLLRDLHDLLSDWFTKGLQGVVKVDCEEATDGLVHPVPAGTVPSASVELWSEQVGKLFSIYEETPKDRDFLGIASDSAFAGVGMDLYEDIPVGTRTFPLVGTVEADMLDDAYAWEVNRDIVVREVTFNEVKKNAPVLGGEVHKPSSRGSHWKVTFSGAERPYMLDYNLDPQPDRYVSEMVDMLHLPLDVIKYTLIKGELPSKKFRLKD